MVSVAIFTGGAATLGAQAPFFSASFAGSSCSQTFTSTVSFNQSVGPCGNTTDVVGAYTLSQTFTGAARADFTGLGAAAILQLDGSTSTPVSTINGPSSRVTVSARDRLSFGGSTGTGIFRVAQTLHGSFTDSERNNWAPRNALFTMSTLTGGGTYSQSETDANFPGSVTSVMDFSFVFGQTVDFERLLILDVGWFSTNLNGRIDALATGDFLNSADFRYEVLDSQFNRVAGATVTGENGYLYAAGETVVPEPTSLALLAMGLLGVLGVAVRRKKIL